MVHRLSIHFIIAIFLLLLTAAQIPAQWDSFAPVNVLPNNSLLQVGDFNRDGILDYLESSGNYVFFERASVTVRVGIGGGLFSEGRRHNRHLIGAADVGDLNGDGIQDFAWDNISSHGQIGLAIGQPNGSFKHSAMLEAPPEIFRANAADLNNDSFLDVVTASWGRSLVNIHLGIDGVNFQEVVSIPVAQLPFEPKIADIDNDGTLDIAVTNAGAAALTLLKGAGDGTFTQAGLLATGPNPLGLEMVDFNGDGLLDIASVSEAGGFVAVFIGTGNMQFTDPAIYEVQEYPREPESGDLNKDGHPDLIVPHSSSGTVSVLLGNGDGTLQSAVHYPANGACFGNVVADLDNDTILDVAVGNYWSNTVSVLKGVGDGTLAAPVAYPVGEGTYDVEFGDLNNDGFLDLVSVNGVTGGASVLLNQQNGSFATEVRYSTDPIARGAVIADFDNDGLLDVGVTAFYQHFRFGSGFSQEFFSPTTILYGIGDGYLVGLVRVQDQPTNLIIDDFNGDSTDDMLVTSYVSLITRLLTGTGTPVPSHEGDFTLQAEPRVMLAANFNGDNRRDIAYLGRPDDTLYVALGDSNTLFQNTFSHTFSEIPREVKTGNFNNDPHTDLLISFFNSPNIIILLGLGDGGFIVNTPISFAPVSAGGVQVRDLDMDGIDDILLESFESAPTSYWMPGNGDGTFQPPEIKNIRINEPIFGDFNGDGATDYIGRNEDYNFTVYINEAEGPLALPGGVNFPDAEAGTAPVAVIFSIINTTAQMLPLDVELLTSNAAPFELLRSPTQLAPGAEGEIEARFTPQEFGDYYATVVITSPELPGFSTSTGLVASAIDTQPPSTRLLAPHGMVVTKSNELFVEWEGSDNDHGSGLSFARVFVRFNGGSYEQRDNIHDLPADTVSFYEGPGVYEMYSVGLDHESNLETPPLEPDITIIKTETPPWTVLRLK